MNPHPRAPFAREGLHHVILAGHRAAGKSRVLAALASFVRRPAFDLDREIEERHRCSISDWLARDVASFRAAERDSFLSLPAGALVAVGGGFWAAHAVLLAPHLVVEVPVSFRTYRERLRADTTRPRLRPELSVEEETRTVYRARELVHRATPHVSLGAFLRELAGAGR